MKKAFAAVFSKPRILLPIVLILALGIGFYAYGRVGNPPVVTDVSLAASSSPLVLQGGVVSVAFNVSGRVASVPVAVGQQVSKGETLATLDAGVAQGAVDQAKGALDLAKAQYGSLSIQYTNAESQQDLLVKNAYSTLLSSGLQSLPFGVNDETHNPLITGTYTCSKEGTYEIDPYASESLSGYSFTIHGLEEGSGNVTYGTPQPLGTCGLLITFVQGFVPTSEWTVSIPNTRSASYQANKNAYDLAVATRAQTLSQLSANLGQNGSGSADVANASISAAQGAYDAALAQLENSTLVSPVDGTVSFIDTSLKTGQSVSAGHSVISITPR